MNDDFIDYEETFKSSLIFDVDVLRKKYINNYNKINTNVWSNDWLSEIPPDQKEELESEMELV